MRSYLCRQKMIDYGRSITNLGGVLWSSATAAVARFRQRDIWLVLNQQSVEHRGDQYSTTKKPSLEVAPTTLAKRTEHTTKIRHVLAYIYKMSPRNVHP